MAVKRGVATAKGAIKRIIKFDKELDIVKTNKFEVVTSMHDSYAHMLFIDPNEGSEIITESKVCKSYNRKPFISISNDFIITLCSLHTKAIKLFKYIIDNIEYGSNHIELDTDTILKVIEGKYQPEASKAINELISKNIVAKSKEYKNCYVINHNEFFKGNYNNFMFKYNKLFNSKD